MTPRPWFESKRVAPAVRMVAAFLLVAAGLLAAAEPTSASILKTRRKRAQQPGTYRELALTIGSGFEFESDSEQSEYGYPFLVEYGFTEALKVTIEPNYASLQPKKGPWISGLGELETSLSWEFVTERRNRPALAAEGLVKWPTAAHAALGTGKTDYSVGVIVSKEFVNVDFDFDGVYTFVGKPPGLHFHNTAEASFAAEWHLSPVVDLEGEILANTGSGGGFRGRPGSIGGLAGGTAASESNGAEAEGTLGLAEHLNDHLKLEEGGVLKSDGSWQAVFAWEWDFGEGR
jgi:hypothetical protein